ncbi:MAG: 16S rRNA (cytidine(1402)-2'-O)-methyltransferase [Actinomycetota bacterium]|nr:16S rRNA (cytidine(1402)-2'-O)-methyltransferase [Actinomycetota bacterium]
MTGRLVLVSTPIGNLGDLPPRAVETLRACALICCEDTRHSGKLLSHAGVSGVRLAVANEHTEVARTEEVLDLLAAGHDVAIVTDAGTPGISDPGARLVKAAVDAGHVVSAVPGPAALVMALVISGFDTSRFVFEGFVPRSGRERTERLAEVAGERRTIILYEAPHRVARTITDLTTACGPERRIALTRELTKKFEEVWRGTLAEAAVHAATIEPRGEYVMVLEGAPAPSAADDAAIMAALHAALGGGADRRAAIATVMAQTGAPKRRVYDLALQIPR